MLENLAYVLNWVLPFAYAATAGAYVRLFAREHAVYSRAARATLFATLGLAIALAVIRWIGEAHVPLSNTSEGITFFTLCTLAVYAYLEIRTGTQAMGIFILGLLFVFQTVASLQYEPFAPLPEILLSGWFASHATSSLLSFSGFAIAAVMSVLYLLLYRELHAGRPGYIFRRIPSLQALDDMAYRGVALGFVLLTVGIVTGSIWAHQAWGRFWSWDPKQCSSLTIWLVYGLYLWARARRGWSGRRVAYFAVIGFAILIFTFVVLERVLNTAHHFV